MTALLTLPEVAEMLRVGRTQLRTMRSKADFPRPVRTTRPMTWRRSDIEAYLERVA